MKNDSIEAKVDGFWAALEATAAGEATRMGFSADEGCWGEVVAALMGRTLAVRAMAKAAPFSDAWNVQSARVAAAEAVVYAHTGAR